MKFIRTFAMLLLACGVATGFPKSSSRNAFNEIFSGGVNSFDLNLHCLTLMPYNLGPGGARHSRYPSYYHVRPIRNLPVDMSASVPITPVNGTYPIISLSGLPTIHEVPLSNFQITLGGQVILKNSNSTSSVTLNAFKSSALANSSGILILEATYLHSADGKLVIQFDYSLDPFYLVNDFNAAAKPLGRNTFQVEVFPTGMIRYSYFSVDVTVAEVGLFSSEFSSNNGSNLNFSDSILRVPDIVRNENSGNAVVGLTLDANVTANSNFQYATRSGTAVTPADYLATSGSGSIVTGTQATSIQVPLVNDTRGELAESLDLIIHSPGNPDWIFAEPRIWILDDDAAAAGSGPRIDLSGNRVIVLPPDPSTVTITGFRLLSLSGGTLLNPLDQSPLLPNSTFTLQAGAAGLIASGLGVHLTVEAIHSGGTSSPVGFDLDGINSSPVFNFTNDRIETSEGGFASVGVSASLAGASVSYQILPLSALPSADYAPTPKTLEFKNGLAMIEIPVFADGVTEGNEEFLVRLINPTPGSFIGPASRARVVISDGINGLRSPTDQVLPDPRPTGRSMNRNQTTSPAWRFVGEPLWRPAFSHGWNLREGLHQVEFRVNATEWKLYMAPDSYLYQSPSVPPKINDLNVAYANFTPTPDPTVVSITGSLQVDLQPAGTTGRWRRVGEGNWNPPGSLNVESGVPVGTQLVEFENAVANFDAPSVRPVSIKAGTTSSIIAKYQPRPTSGAAPEPMVEPDLCISSTTWTNIPISAQTGKFKVSFEFKPTAGSLSWIGLASSSASADTGLAAALKADLTVAATGFTGLSSSTYGFNDVLAPTANQWHFVEFELDPGLGTYILYITPPSGANATAAGKKTIRTTANFRPPAPLLLNYLSMASASGGSCSIRGIRVEKIHPTSTWRIVEFPDQTGIFDIAVQLDIQTKFSFPPSSPNDFPFSFGLSDGRSNIPTHSFGSFNFDQPASLGASGRLAPLAVRVSVDLISRTYQIYNGADSIGSGIIPTTLTKANCFYVFTTLSPSTSTADITEFRIADSILPPAYAPPTGTGVNQASNWTHIPITPQTGRFSLTCDIRTVGQTIGSGDRIDSLLGLSSTKVTWWNQIAVALRAKLPASGTDVWDAYTSVIGDFTQEGNLPVVDGKLYHATFHVDVPAKTFRISIAPDDGGPVVILSAGTFQHQATELRYLTLRSVQGRLEVSNVRGPLSHPLDSPAYFTGQIETPNGFGTGTVVADHVVMTSARLVIDPATGNFFSRGITWRRSEGGYSVIPDACEPSHVLLPTRYSATALNTLDGDSHDVALLVFRPLDVPDSDNAPGGGCFSGFQVDDGSGSWTTEAVKRFPSFPVSGITAANQGKVHSTDLSAVSFSGAGVLKTASGVPTPPGSEGASVFVQGADKILRPAAVCIGAADGTSRFRTIDAEIAEAIYQANSYQRQPGFLQELLKGGVYYIPQTLSTSADPNRAHILSNAIPPAAKWTLKRGSSLISSGGQAVSVEPGPYQVTFGDAPSGYTRTGVASMSNTLGVGTTWNLPAVYTANPPSSYATWVDAHYDEFEAASAISAPASSTPWIGINNLTAYAFGFDPNLGPTRFADPPNGIPGYPLVTINRSTTPPTIVVEFLRRTNDPKLAYQIQYSDTLSGWGTVTDSPVILSAPTGWERVRWTFTSPPGKFVRTRVTLE